MVGGAVLFGPAWFDPPDPLGVLYRLLCRVSPVAIVAADDGGVTLAARPPWTGCFAPAAGLGSVAFVVAAVYHARGVSPVADSRS